MPVSDQGVNLPRYRVIPRTLIFLVHNSEVLLIRGAPAKRLWANRYNGLGGHIERGEDPLSAAKRELKEEAGIENVELHGVGVILVDVEPDIGVCIFIFRGEAEEKWTWHSEEGALEWVPWEDLPHLPLVEDLPQILPRVWEWRPGDPVFWAVSRYENGYLVVHFHSERDGSGGSPLFLS